MKEGMDPKKTGETVRDAPACIREFCQKNSELGISKALMYQGFSAKLHSSDGRILGGKDSFLKAEDLKDGL